MFRQLKVGSGFSQRLDTDPHLIILIRNTGFYGQFVDVFLFLGTLNTLDMHQKGLTVKPKYAVTSGLPSTGHITESF